MSRPTDHLEDAYADAKGVEGAEFFRCLNDYWELLTTDERIQHALAGMESDAAQAREAFTRLDDELVGDLKRCRRELVALERSVDDSGAKRPRFPNLEYGAELAVWRMTLANFDAICGGNMKDLEAHGPNGGRSQMLCAILRAKLQSLPDGPVTSKTPRPDLSDLWDRVVDIDNRQQDAYRQLERQRDSIGFLSLVSLQVLMSPVRGSSGTEDDTALREWVQKRLDHDGPLSGLREVMDPPQAGLPLSERADDAAAAFEPDAKENLRRVHRRLQRRLEPKGILAPVQRMNSKERFTLAVATTVALAGIVVPLVLNIVA